jgi:hypothetical protein
VTASSSVVLSNLAYLIGAVVLAVIGGVAVWWRHRKPTSVHANMASFHRGLRALAPDGEESRPAPDPGIRIEPRAGGTRAVSSGTATGSGAVHIQGPVHEEERRRAGA